MMKFFQSVSRSNRVNYSTTTTTTNNNLGTFLKRYQNAWNPPHRRLHDPAGTGSSARRKLWPYATHTHTLRHHAAVESLPIHSSHQAFSAAAEALNHLQCLPLVRYALPCACGAALAAPCTLMGGRLMPPTLKCVRARVRVYVCVSARECVRACCVRCVCVCVARVCCASVL